MLQIDSIKEIFTHFEHLIDFSISISFSMQFERNALSPTNIITQPTFHSSSNINALKYNLFQQNLNDNYVKTPSTSSEEGNSPTELNNCRRILEKPPLVSVRALQMLELVQCYILKATKDIMELNVFTYEKNEIF